MKLRDIRTLVNVEAPARSVADKTRPHLPLCR